MPVNLSEEELLKQARFVFKGTVQQLKAANVAEVDDKERKKTVLVRVDEVVQAPETLDDYTGQDVTMKLSPDEKVKVGQKAVFYTNTWIFSDNIAVESLGHKDVEGPELMMASTFRDPAQNLAQQKVKERLETADMVVMGKVTSIQLPEDTGTPGAVTLSSAASATTTSGPITEHDPHWREAVVEVSSVEKGTHNKQDKVRIRFPESNDVRWYKAPKFRPGQEGVFILHKTQKTAQPEAGRIAATLTAEEADTDEAYTALHPADFQPLHQHPEIQTLIKGIPSSEGSTASSKGETSGGGDG